VAPVWITAWPAAGLCFLACPLRCILHDGSEYLPSRTRCSKSLVALLLFSLAVVGAGVTSLVELSMAAVHYAARCPMKRADGRCTIDVCPSPPCKRESDFSPCLCGLMDEAEMARALFLNGFAACQPYEWYSWQMEKLEALILRYETFACVVAPLTCAATAVGGALVLSQLACCPLLIIGLWGGRHGILVFLGSLEEHVVILDDANSPVVGTVLSSEMLAQKIGALVPPGTGDDERSFDTVDSPSQLMPSKLSLPEASLRSRGSSQNSSRGNSMSPGAIRC